MKKDKLIKSVLAVLLATSFVYTNNAFAEDEFIIMDYQAKFEKALDESSESNPLLIMDFDSYNAWEDIVKETESLRQSVIEDFQAYSKYRVTYQEENMPSAVNLTDQDNIGDTLGNSGATLVSNDITNGMSLDENAFASLKLQGIMQSEYKVASTDTGSDAIIDTMDLSYSKVMDNYFRGIGKTDVKEISAEFIKKFLKEPCQSAEGKENFEMRRLMLYRETIKETAGLGYYAQVQSLDWDELLQDFEADIDTYTQSGDINKVIRLNFLLRQFLNKLFAIYVQTKSSQTELMTVKRVFRDGVILYKKTMEYAENVLEEANANSD